MQRSQPLAVLRAQLEPGGVVGEGQLDADHPAT